MTDDEVAHAVAALKSGGIVAAATETFYGLLADARLAGALDALFDLKGRDAGKGVALLLPNEASWRTLVDEVSPIAERLAARFWPGPLTIALAARSGLDPRLVVDGTVAVRWPGPSDAARIVSAFGSPVTATSANRAGEPPCVTSDDVKAAFSRELAAGAGRELGALTVVEGRAEGGEPSTIVAFGDGRVRIVRSGRVKESDLASVVPASFLREM
jgi:L-threonylcarbamoyladenylate synthase